MTTACGREKYGRKRSRSCGRIKSGREDGEKRSHRGEGRGEAGRKRWHGDRRTGRGSRRAINPTTRHLPPPKARQRTPPTDETARQKGPLPGSFLIFQVLNQARPIPNRRRRSGRRKRGECTTTIFIPTAPFYHTFEGFPSRQGMRREGCMCVDSVFFGGARKKPAPTGKTNAKEGGGNKKEGGQERGCGKD